MAHGKIFWTPRVQENSPTCANACLLCCAAFKSNWPGENAAEGRKSAWHACHAHIGSARASGPATTAWQAQAPQLSTSHAGFTLSKAAGANYNMFNQKCIRHAHVQASFSQQDSCRAWSCKSQGDVCCMEAGHLEKTTDVMLQNTTR